MRKVIVSSRNSSRFPEFGGSSWVRLQYVLGLRKLGIESYWVESLDAVDPLVMRRSVTYLAERFHQRLAAFGLGDSYCINYNAGERYFGMSKTALEHLSSSADLVLNLNGWMPKDSPLTKVPRRAYLDVDPGFTQLWALDMDMNFDQHNFFFTVGQNVTAPDFKIPTHGVPWRPILPPVVLDQWPAVYDERCQTFTTVADWRGAQNAIFEGQHMGGKRSEFVKMIRLPQDSGQKIELALCIGLNESEDLGLLAGNGWVALDANLYAGDPFTYREFIQTSRAEFSVAKNGYVRSNSGWISDRTACYLASGKPALVQSTGFESRVPTGKGLLTFKDLAEAIAGVRDINANYQEHSQAARALAEQYFSSDVVLGRMLEQVGL